MIVGLGFWVFAFFLTKVSFLVLVFFCVFLYPLYILCLWLLCVWLSAAVQLIVRINSNVECD